MVITYRDATEADLPAIVNLLGDDPIGSRRENMSEPLAPSYRSAFAAMSALPNQRLIVAVEGQDVVGTLQLLFIPSIARGGSRRGQIEAVRIASKLRGMGHGERFIRWAIDECRLAGCALVQLTSDNARPDAHRFWQKMGFSQTHVGFRLTLPTGVPSAAPA